MPANSLRRRTEQKGAKPAAAKLMGSRQETDPVIKKTISMRGSEADRLAGFVAWRNSTPGKATTDMSKTIQEALRMLYENENFNE
jgi:hypothetical protein